MDDSILDKLEQRLGRLHARQRLGIESETEPTVFGHGINFFHPENWYSAHALIRFALKTSGLYGRGRRNALGILVNRNVVSIPELPRVFDGYRILHLSDLHVDMDKEATDALIDRLQEVDYDLCVMTGDYRARTFGPIDATLEEMERVRQRLTDPIYAVLGNHDSICMVPALESIGIRMLLNESIRIDRKDASIYLAGIDDAHFFRVDNIEKAAEGIAKDACTILLSHTPEIYRQAAYADFNLILCGHTHGGQICLPGGFPLTLDARCPRYMGSGAWSYHNMIGYTSVGAGTSIVNVRLNCPPEITVHELRKR